MLNGRARTWGPLSRRAGGKKESVSQRIIRARKHNDHHFTLTTKKQPNYSTKQLLRLCRGQTRLQRLQMHFCWQVYGQSEAFPICTQLRKSASLSCARLRSASPPLHASPLRLPGSPLRSFSAKAGEAYGGKAIGVVVCDAAQKRAAVRSKHPNLASSCSLLRTHE